MIEITHENIQNITELEIFDTSIKNDDLNSLLDTLDKVSKQWCVSGRYSIRAKNELNEIVDLELKINILSDLLKKENLLKRIRADFGHEKFLKGFYSKPNYSGRIKYQAKGIICHVTAGNNELGAIDSLLMGLITLNKNIVKLSSDGNPLLEMFVESCLEYQKNFDFHKSILLLKWKGGDSNIENIIFKNVDSIIGWGGEEMALSLKKTVPRNKELILHGPKISFQVISSKAFLEDKINYNDIAKDIITWNQSACANSQNIFIEENISIQLFIDNLAKAFERLEVNVSHTDESALEHLKEKYLGLYTEFETGITSHCSEKFQIIYDQNKGLRPSPLNNSVFVKTFRTVNELCDTIRPYDFYLQTCGLAVGKEERDFYLSLLASSGIKRFTALGKMLEGVSGSPHDGRYSLLELTNVVCDEARLESDNLNTQYGGFHFSSGGTTSEPKFSFYSYSEFREVVECLAYSYQLNGIKVNDVVANLFMAGNMWSSFTAIQRALEYCSAIQLPIGGNVSCDDFKKLTEKFDINCVFGLPSLLVSLAEKTTGEKIEKVFYAGESFSEAQKSILERHWGVKKFISAGYATVEVGPIGYQDDSCDVNEHILFDEIIDLQIVDGHSFVSSKIKTVDPIKNYDVGDELEWTKEKNGKKYFKIKGRVDQKINIWSSRFNFSELRDIIVEQTGVQKIQVNLTDEEIDGEHFEFLNIHLEGNPIFDYETLKKFIYSSLKDVSDTRTEEFVCKRIRFINENFHYHYRTGKLKPINDQRL